jgi:hypothetical protein
MPIRARYRHAVVLGAALALICACAERGTDSHPPSEVLPVSEPAPFQVDPAHHQARVRHDAVFLYDQPVAAPRDADEQPRRRIPAALKKKVPVVLDLTGTVKDFVMEPLPLAEVVAIRVYDGGRRQLAAYTVADDCDASVERRMDFTHDIGETSKTIAHLRMAASAALDAHLREIPGDEVTIVGFDAQDRIMLVAHADGCRDAETGIDKGIRIGSSVVWLGQHPDYAPRGETSRWRYTANFVDDEPVALPPDQIIGDVPPKAAKAPAKYRAKVPLVLDLHVTIPDYQGEPGLAKVVAIHILGDRQRLLATRSAAKDCWYTSSTCQLSEGASSAPFTIEHLRTALDPALFAGMSVEAGSSLWVVAVDAKGRTVACELLSPPAPPARTG